MATIGINALHVAIGELTKGVADGRGETRLSSQVKVYLVYCYASYPNPWCAAFLSWCLGQAARMSGYQLPVFRTASTIDLGIFANHQALVLMGTDDSEPGDFYVLALDVDNPQTDFHCGIVKQKLNGSQFLGIEGNHDYKVATVTRDASKLLVFRLRESA